VTNKEGTPKKTIAKKRTRISKFEESRIRFCEKGKNEHGA
jgi:hypothetical protein